ncbi:Sec-independent protein translocase TatB [Psychrobacter arcticus 273-4]|uniref:Sec-independent protein translocase protein TatB n=1 Tax=Psychrobacter arcticus (strain DSM 17307 / VKM B-2377 / 273-4) TaxID=259536 RepID=TATB_PSYA2|nr:Sec-independent protein translocase protein TatB [Psychrobacter arcticus]Q4FQ60.1 RecName: Full=Sec-independent protein translocase protein TatB [Psychrobacter arcticus 273-4]AAZ19848.1 Sec-independent protein translocase TatB [Psychrobacter arcticus 273-4]
MFDIGFSELLLFGVIALIVLGPEKLPQAARTAGQWYAKIRRTVSTLQSEIEAELDLAETRQLMQKELAKIRQTEAEMRREMAEMRGSIKEFEHSQSQNLKTSDKAASPANQANNDSAIQNNNEPATFSYAYGQSNNLTDSQQLSNQDITSINSDAVTDSSTIKQPAQPLITKPWENMWFRLGAYDKARRLPAVPYLPNYKADILLNSSFDSSFDSPLNTQASVNQQESE